MWADMAAQACAAQQQGRADQAPAGSGAGQGAGAGSSSASARQQALVQYLKGTAHWIGAASALNQDIIMNAWMLFRPEVCFSQPSVTRQHLNPALPNLIHRALT